MNGVVAFFSARDVPGKNLFISKESLEPMLNSDELVNKNNH